MAEIYENKIPKSSSGDVVADSQTNTLGNLNTKKGPVFLKPLRDFFSSQSVKLKNRKFLFIIPVIFIIVLTLFVFMMVKKKRDMVSETPSQTPQEETRSISPESLEQRLKNLRSELERFDLEERPLQPPEIEFGIEI